MKGKVKLGEAFIQGNNFQKYELKNILDDVWRDVTTGRVEINSLRREIKRKIHNLITNKRKNENKKTKH
jgi:hypothetical protein